MSKTVLAVLIAATMMLTACSFDEISTSEPTIAKTTTKTTTEATAGRPIRDRDSIYFGSYYEHNGRPGQIEWTILKEEDGKLLIISNDILDYQPYDKNNRKVTWETCSLRSWLNNDFINAAFNASEQEYILTMPVSDSANKKYGTKAGKNTKDKIFLLSANEADKFFADKEERRLNNEWWLRSSDKANRTAASVAKDGWATSGGYIRKMWQVDSVLGVRPVMWIKLES